MDIFDGKFLDGCSVDVDPPFDGPVSQTAIANWQGRFPDATLTEPLWGDHLMAMYEIASSLIVKDVVDGGTTYANRFWGTRIVTAFGFDATRKSLADYYDPLHVDQLHQLYELTFAERRPVKIGGNATFFEGREFVEFESAQLPIFSPDGRPAHVLVSYDFFRG